MSDTMTFGRHTLPLRPLHGGLQGIITFDNGYTASIVRHRFSRGSEDGLFEVAVMRGGRLVYDTPITADVVGNLTPEDVGEVLDRMAALPATEED